jgi:hypothetical protein
VFGWYRVVQGSSLCWGIGLNPITLRTSEKTRDSRSSQHMREGYDGISYVHVLRKFPNDFCEPRLTKSIIWRLSNRLAIFGENIHRSGGCSWGVVIRFGIITTLEEGGCSGNFSTRPRADVWSRESWFSSIHEEERKALSGLSQWRDVEVWKLKCDHMTNL